MNKRILEIAEQAGMSYYPKYRMWASAYHTEVEKFAELIIRECIKIAQDTRENEIAGNQLIDFLECINK